MSALIRAIRAKKPLAEIQAIVDSDPKSVEYKDEDGWTALHHAASIVTSDGSDLQVVKLLINTRWDSLTELDNERRLPLHVAAKFARYDVVECICREWSAAINQTTKGGMTPLHLAALQQPLAVVHFLVNEDRTTLNVTEKYGCLPLHLAAQSNNWMEVIQFLERESPPGALARPTKNGKLPLHLVAARGSLPLVECIANKYGRAVDVPDDNGWIPLHYAARFNPSPEAEVVKFLVGKRDSSTRAVTNSGKLPLHLAVEQELFEAVRFLANSFESALDATDSNGWLPLHVAANSNENSDVVQILVARRPGHLLSRDTKGRLAIHLSIRGSPQSMLMALFLASKCPPSLDKQDAEGRFAVHLAAACWPRDYFVQLATMSPSHAFDAMDCNRLLPVDYACRNPDPSVERWLKERPKKRQLSRTLSPSSDRERIRAFLEQMKDAPGVEPVRVSSNYVESIRTDIRLGGGCFGTVYKGEDAELRHEFAVKVIKMSILQGGSEKHIEEAIRSFKTEQKALSRFRHPNISALIAYTDLEVYGTGYLVYELAENGSLDQFLLNDLGRSRLSSFFCRARIAVDVLTAIRFLHVGNGEIVSCFHRDIKSANIVLKRDLTAQLTDCGIAKFIQDVQDDSGSTLTRDVRGTPGYICPQYSSGSPYEAACDIYSFGVVLTELWTGKMQNYLDKTGSQFEYRARYVTEQGDIMADVDRAMGHCGRVPDYMQQYAKLAVTCMAPLMKHRPAGDKVLETLHSILEATSPVMDQRIFDELKGRASPEDIEMCELCRSCTKFQELHVCLHCLVLTAVREGNALLLQEIRSVGKNVELSLPILADLDRKFIHEIPRIFVLVPADIQGTGWRHPRSWLCSKGFTKYYLFFVCHLSKKAIASPIKLHVAKEWVRNLAPVLAYGLLSLQIAMKVGLNLDLTLYEAAKGIIDFSFTLSLENISEMVQEVSSILDETNNQDLMERIKSEVQENKEYEVLSGDAYELVREKAREQRDWQSQMKAVRKPPDPRVFWVANAVADDPKNELVIVNG